MIKLQELIYERQDIGPALKNRIINKLNRLEELETAVMDVIRQHYSEDCNPDGINRLVEILERK